MAHHSPERRLLLKGLAGGLLTASASPLLGDTPTPSATPATTSGIPMITFGKAKIHTTKFVLGGSHIGYSVDEPTGLAIIKRALELGVRFFDSANSYGPSEDRLAKVLAGRRSEVTLMSKSFRREPENAERELEESLKRQHTDHFDLWQFHSVNNLQEVEAIARKGGVADVARKALADGRIRVLGATSHNSPESLLALIDRVPEIEVLQFPVNCVDKHWKSFMDTVLPVANKRGLTIIAMKTLARGALARVPNLTVKECHRYALSQPITAWVSGVETVAQLEENVALISNFTPMTPAEQANLLRRSEPAKGVQTEDYKTWVP